MGETITCRTRTEKSRSLCRRWSQRHEDPENDDANYRHQNDVAVSFHYQCLLYIEALMAIPAIPRIVLAMTWASVGGGATTTTGGPTPLSRAGPVLRFVLPRQRFVRRCHRRKKAPTIKGRGKLGGGIQPSHRAERFLVAPTSSGDLFICAKELFVDATQAAISFGMALAHGDR